MKRRKGHRLGCVCTSMKTASSEALEEATLGARPERTAGIAEGVKFSSDLQVFQAVGRTAAFWRRASRIYFGYKSAQAQAAFLGHPGQTAKDIFWHKHHAWAGAEMYSLAVDLRGFYLKVSVKLQQQLRPLISRSKHYDH